MNMKVHQIIFAIANIINYSGKMETFNRDFRSDFVYSMCV